MYTDKQRPMQALDECWWNQTHPGCESFAWLFWLWRHGYIQLLCTPFTPGEAGLACEWTPGTRGGHRDKHTHHNITTCRCHAVPHSASQCHESWENVFRQIPCHARIIIFSNVETKTFIMMRGTWVTGFSMLMPTQYLVSKYHIKMNFFFKIWHLKV